MNAVTSRRGVALAAVVAVGLLVGGCRAPGAPSGTSPVTSGSGAHDPLGGVEATVGAVERDLDADADVAGR
jgi:hypothetical protein